METEYALRQLIFFMSAIHIFLEGSLYVANCAVGSSLVYFQYILGQPVIWIFFPPDSALLMSVVIDTCDQQTNYSVLFLPLFCLNLSHTHPKPSCYVYFLPHMSYDIARLILYLLYYLPQIQFLTLFVLMC